MENDLDLSVASFVSLLSIDDAPQWPETAPTAVRFAAWLPYVNAIIVGPASRSLEIALAAIRAARSDQDLTWLGMTLLEPLLDIHAAQIFDQFERLARADKALRTALGGAVLDIRPNGKRRGGAGRQYEARVQRLLEL